MGNNLVKIIESKFNSKVIKIVYCEGKYFFRLEKDPDLENTMNIRYIDEKNNFGLLDLFDDLDFYDRLLEAAETNAVSF